MFKKGLSEFPKSEITSHIDLSNRIALILFFVATPYIFIFQKISLDFGLMVIPIVSAFLLSIFANKKNFHDTGRFLLISSASMGTYYYADALGRAAGVQFLYFAFIGMPFILFDQNEKIKSVLATLITVACIGTLEVSGYGLFSRVNIPDGYELLIYRTAMLAVLTIIAVYIHYYSSKIETAYGELQGQYQELKEKKRMDAELVAAAEIQRSALPQSPPKINGFVVEDWFVPARGVSGDFFDYVDISATKTGFLIADITGKGIPAALMMMNLRSLWHSFDASVGTPAEILTQLNTLLYYHPTIQKQVPMIYGILDTESRMFTYCNAGHEPGLHVRENNAEELKVSGPALGVEATITLEDHAIALSENDRLLLFTDGVTDVENPKKNRFGHAALLDMIFVLTASLPEANFLETFKENLMVFMGHEPQADDITLLSIKVEKYAI